MSVRDTAPDCLMASPQVKVVRRISTTELDESRVSSMPKLRPLVHSESLLQSLSSVAQRLNEAKVSKLPQKKVK